MKNVKTIFKGIVGSQAYGTNIPTSDIDFKGVYIQSIDDLISFNYREQYEAGKDECYYELRRFIQLLGTANPTVLEMLFLPQDCIAEKHPVFEILIKERHKFLTKKCLNSFGGYAIAQIKKARGLDKKMNWEKQRVERKGIMDFCFVITPLGPRNLRDWLGYQKGNGCRQEFYGVTAMNNARDMYFIYPSDGDLGYHGIVNYDETSNEIRLSNIPKSEMLKGVPMSYNKDGYMRHCKDFKEYNDWKENRNTQRYVDTTTHGQQIDGKNLMHCRRLLDMAIEIAKTGDINVRRPNRDHLLDIRKGNVNLDDIITKAEEDVKGLDAVYAESSLPDDVSMEYMNDLLLRVRKAFYGWISKNDSLSKCDSAHMTRYNRLLKLVYALQFKNQISNKQLGLWSGFLRKLKEEGRVTIDELRSVSPKLRTKKVKKEARNSNS